MGAGREIFSFNCADVGEFPAPGDGCFGRAARAVEPQTRWYNEHQKSIAHFWLIEITKNDGVRFRAIDAKNDTVDRFSLP